MRVRVLGHVHTFNEEDVIDRSLQALLDQSYPVADVLLVDNASTDNTLNRTFAPNVTVIRHAENLLTSGAITTAMVYAIEHHYDWLWILNGDSAPRKDALEKLVELYSGFPPELQEQTWLLDALPVDATTRRANHGFRVTSRGLRQVVPRPGETFYECDATIWSGSVYKVPALQRVGFPRADYPMDIAEIEYGYRGRQAGYRAFVHLGSVLDHNIGGPSVQFTEYRLGPVPVRLLELRPYRCYYVVACMVDFWLYEYRNQTALTYAYCVVKIAKLMASFLVRPLSRWRELMACLHGVRDGIRRRIDPRYLRR